MPLPRKKLLPVLGVVLVLLLVSLAFKYALDLTLDKTKTSEQSEQVAKDNASRKKEFVENSQKTGPKPGTNSSENYTPPNNPDNIKLSAQQNGDNVVVMTQLYGYSDGTCAVVATSGSSSTEQTADVIYQSQYSSCAGFSIPKDKLSAGTWSIKLTVTSGGVSETQSTSLEVH